VVAATRFVAIGILPPSVSMRPFAHATASTEVGLGKAWLTRFGNPNAWNPFAADAYNPYAFSTRTYTLADMMASPELTTYVARAAGLPASKIGILGPVWKELWRQQQWPSPSQRDRQLLIENDPYQIAISQDSTQPLEGPGPGSGPPVIDVQAQAPTVQIASRLAGAVPVALSAFMQHAQATEGVPGRDRYDITQLVPVSVAPARKSQLANVGVFTFLAVFLLWCGAEIAIFSLMRDLRAASAASKVGDSDDRSSESGQLLAGAR
jgi:hypothetical protein